MPTFPILIHTSPFIFLKRPSLRLPPAQRFLQNTISHRRNSWLHSLDSQISTLPSHQVFICCSLHIPSPMTPPSYLALFVPQSIGIRFSPSSNRHCVKSISPTDLAWPISLWFPVSTSLISLVIEYFWELIIYLLCTLPPLTKLRGMIKLFFICRIILIRFAAWVISNWSRFLDYISFLQTPFSLLFFSVSFSTPPSIIMGWVAFYQDWCEGNFLKRHSYSSFGSDL